jgi:hypothetical protein
VVLVDRHLRMRRIPFPTVLVNAVDDEYIGIGTPMDMRRVDDFDALVDIEVRIIGQPKRARREPLPPPRSSASKTASSGTWPHRSRNSASFWLKYPQTSIDRRIVG